MGSGIQDRQNEAEMKLKTGFFLAVIFLLQGCEKDDFCNCVKSEGSTISETRTLPAFENIEMNNNVDVELTPDTVTFAVLTCGKNLADGIETEVSNNTLIIRNKNRCNWLRDFDNKFTLNVHYNKITHIGYFGSGNLSCTDTIRADSLLVESWNGTGKLSFVFNGRDLFLKLHTGTADIAASGIASLLYVYTAGNGYIRAGNLSAEQVLLTTNSTGDSEVLANNLLDVNIGYNGDVFYHGSPSYIRKMITGHGNLYPF